jgi:hypothetical protein
MDRARTRRRPECWPARHLGPLGVRSADRGVRNCLNPPRSAAVLHSFFFLRASLLCAGRVSQRCCAGGITEVCRCGSHVGVEFPFVCRRSVGLSALCTPVSAFLAHACPTHHCCPVSRPLWPSRGRLRRFAPAAMQASSCSSVRAALYFLEAAASRARQCSWFGVCGSRGLTQRRRPCLLPGSRYHTQSPHRPLLMVVSRHRPEGAQNGQSRHRGLRRGADAVAFPPLDLLGTSAFIHCCYFTTMSVGLQPFFAGQKAARAAFLRRSALALIRGSEA